MKYICNSENDTRDLAIKLSKSKDKIYFLKGNLGVGKTFFVREFLKNLGIRENITSPTYQIVKEYHGKVDAYHFDLYRIEDYEELIHIDFDEYINSDSYIFIEWPEIVEDEYQAKVIKFYFDNGNRIIEVEE